MGPEQPGSGGNGSFVARTLTVCRRTLCVWALAVVPGQVLCAGPTQRTPSDAGQPRQPLTTIQQIRQLSREEAAGHVPVHITAVVNCVLGVKKFAFFVADRGNGISVETPPGVTVALGDRVEVTGVSGAGKFAPIIQAKAVRFLGHAPPPRPRRFSYSDLIGGTEDSQPIEVEGIVHSAAVNRVFGLDTLVIGLDMGGGMLRVLLQQYSVHEAERLVDARIRVHGVCITNFNENRQFVSPGLWVPLQADLQVLKPPSGDPFSAVPTPIGEVMRFGAVRNRIKVTGTVTYEVPGHFLYLQQGSDGIRVQMDSAEPVPLGQQVEAVGFPLLGDYSPVLTGSLLRVGEGGVPIVPAAVEAGEVIVPRAGFTRSQYDQQLIQVRGTLIESHMQGQQMVSILLGGGKSFEAYLALPDDRSSAELMQRLTPGGVLQLTGICSIHTDLNRYPVSFSILLRSPDDIVVLRRAPWWNAAHLFMLLAALSVVVLAATLWVMLLRRQVRRQTSLLRASEEKYRFLATHDSLTGLLNRAAILEALHAAVEEAKLRRVGIGVAVVDLDHFKSVNDTLGHNAGDEILREAAKRLASAVRKTDVVGRYGGEEFLVVLRNMNQQLSLERCEAIRMTLSRDPVVFEGKPLKLTGSIGIACAQKDVRSAKDLIAQADAAMYQAKASGRNRVVYFCDPAAVSGVAAEEGSRESAMSRR